MMNIPIKIDFVSDVSCPWCVIGLKSLEQALARLDGVVEAQIHFQPFELNPDMGAEGQDLAEHIAEKYGYGAERMAQAREAIRARGAELGFVFEMGQRTRIYNTFDAHRLLHWAGLEGRQPALKQALFEAYFTLGGNPSSPELLMALARQVGLDGAAAAQVLASGAYADEVRAQQRFYRQQGISAVPAIIINERHLISGGQSPEVFEQALRQIAAGA
ncbi:putative DsbA family dithiol-disulfide isomerase [Janthinobacterium sp. CG_S6]|nr:putative DsbA family dithiol-disulfide isomerase [Janthinobacterium sp. CG_S6]